MPDDQGSWAVLILRMFCAMLEEGVLLVRRMVCAGRAELVIFTVCMICAYGLEEACGEGLWFPFTTAWLWGLACERPG